MEEFVSKFTIEIIDGNLIVTPIHCIDLDATPYEHFVFPLEGFEKVEMAHDGFSNWKHRPIKQS